MKRKRQMKIVRILKKNAPRKIRTKKSSLMLMRRLATMPKTK
jgi:hypothetical protein